MLCASFLHDAGLYGPASSGDVYIKDSGRYARRTLEPLGWSEERLRACVDAQHALAEADLKILDESIRAYLSD